jgi:FMN phosphatase YigB (HAD superfamily)
LRRTCKPPTAGLTAPKYVAPPPLALGGPARSARAPPRQALLTALQAERRVRLCLLSNYAVAWYARVDAAVGLARFFRPGDIVLSGKTGHRKPEAAAYQAVLEVAQAPASACVLIDDREANCVAARAAGLRAVRFESVAALAHADALAGVLPLTCTAAAAL